METESEKNEKIDGHTLGELFELRLRVVELEEAEARRQRVDKALRLSEKYFRTLIENSRDVITILDNEGVITYQSPSIKHVLGYSDEELLGQNVLQYIHPDDSAMIIESMARVVDTRDVIEPFSFGFRHKDGSWCHLEGTIQAIVEGSELIGVIVSSRDISRRKRAEKELCKHQEHLEVLVLERTAELEKMNYLLQREVGERRRAEEVLDRSEKYYRSLVEKSFDFVTVMDAGGRCLYISPSVETVTGYRPEEIMDEDPFDLMHPADREMVLEAFNHIVREPGYEGQVKYRIRHKDGSNRFLEAVGSNMLDDPGVQGVVVHIRDITERMLAEEALVRSEKYYRSLVEDAFDFVSVSDAEANYSYVSPSVERVLGYSAEEMMKKKGYELIHPEDAEGIMDTYYKLLLDEGGSRLIRCRVRHKDGSWRYCEAVGRNLLDDPAVAGIVVNARDVTELKQAELEKKRRDNYFQELFKHAHDLIIVINEDGTIRFINSAIEPMLGYKVEEVMGRDALEQMHPDDVQKIIEPQLNADQSQAVEIRVRHRDGSWRWHEVTTANLFDHPAVGGLVINTRDITERKLAEDILRESEEKFRSIANAATDAIISIDHQGRITYMNAAGEKIFGYTSQEVLGKEMHTIFIPERFRNEYRMGIEAILAAGDTEFPAKPMELPGMRKDGTEFMAEVSVSAFQIQGVWHFQALVRDITERKAAEEALRESEERYRTLVENINDIIFTVDTMGKVVYISPVIERISGYRADEVIGRSFTEFVHPDDLTERQIDFERTLQGQLQVSEYRLLDKDGSTRYVRSSSRPIVKDGKVIGLTGVMTDITERKESEEALRRSERYFRSLFENALDIITVLNEEGNVMYESPSVERILGYKPGEFLGKNVFEFIHQEDVERVYKTFTDGIQVPGTIEHLDLRFSHADGSWRYLEVTGYNLLDDPSVGGVVINARDISERKKAEVSLRESEEKYRDLVENINEVIFTLDNDGYVTYCSPAIERLSGYKVEDLMGRHFAEFIYPDDLQGIMARRAQIFRGEEEPFEYRVVDKDGSTRYVRTHAHLQYKDGEVTGMIMVMTDISEKKKSEEELRIRDAALASSVSAISIADLDGYVTYMNDACLKFWGYEELEQALGKHIADFWESRKTTLEIGRALRDEGVWMGEITAKREDGLNTRIFLSANVVKDDAGKPIRYMVSFLDITDRVKAEEALKESEEQFRLLSEQSMMGIFIIQDNLIKYVNKAGVAINEYSIEEALNWGPMEYTKTVHPDERDFVAEQVRMKQSGESGYIKNYTYRLLTKTGKVKWVEIYSKTVIYEGRTADFVTMIDVTDRVHVEEELKRSEEYFRSLIEDASDVIVTINEEGLVNYVSPSIERVLGYKAEEVVDDVRFGFIHPEDVFKAIELFKQILDNPGKNYSIDLRVQHKDGSWRVIDINVRNLLDHPSVKAIVANYRDVTDRKRVDEALHHRLEVEGIVSAISTNFIKLSLADTDSAIDDALQSLGTFSGVDRSYIFLFSADGTIMVNTHEWCAEGIEPQKDSLQALPVEGFPWWMKKLKRFETIYIPRITDLPPEASAEREILQSQNIQSLVVVPLVYSDSLVGFLGLDSVWVERMWAEEDIALLKTAAEILVNALERKRTEDALNFERRQLLSVFDSINEVIYVADPNTYEILYANKALKDAFGKELIGGICYREFQNRDTPCDFCTNTIISGSENQPYIWEYHNPILNRDYMITDRMIKWPDGRDVRFELAIDITDRVAMREQLFKINNLFLSLGADLIENMDMIVGTCCDILGGAISTYCRMQKGRFSILSNAPGEDSLTITEKPDDYLCSAVLSRGLDEPMIIQDIGDSSYADVDPLVRKYHLKSYIGYPVQDKKGKVIGCLGVFFDEKREPSHEDLEMMGVFARALSVEEERLSQEESLKDFIDIASHELRHPITLMKGYALMMRDFGDKMDDMAKTESLNMIDEGAGRLDLLVKELLDVSRIERGRFKIDQRRVNLKPLMERAVKEMEDKGRENRFIISVDDEVGSLELDTEKIIGVLVILLDNAVNNSPKGSQVELTAESADGGAVVSVLDRGRGIPEEQRKLIFERFFQVEDAQHHSTPGMGLGLYIAREIIEHHGGTIWCEPREDGGTAFRFTIP